MNTNNDTAAVANQMAQKAAQAALEEQKAEARQKKIEEKRAARARVSAVGVDNPFDIPAHLLDPSMHYAIINDKPGHIADMQARGYEMVRDKKIAEYLGQKPGDPVKFATGMTNPAWAYLMYIEKELFEDDQKSWQEKNDETMSALGNAPKDLKFAKDASVTGVHLQKEETL